jgi:hypothetical protein
MGAVVYNIRRKEKPGNEIHWIPNYRVGVPKRLGRRYFINNNLTYTQQHASSAQNINTLPKQPETNWKFHRQQKQQQKK